MAYTYTLADYIYQDRVLFSIPKSKYHVEASNPLTEFYYYDEEGTARVRFDCWYNKQLTSGYHEYFRGLSFYKCDSKGNGIKNLTFTSGGSSGDGEYKNTLIIETKVNKETEYLDFYVNGNRSCNVSKAEIYENFSVNFKPINRPPSIDSDELVDTIPPSDDNFTDNPPKIWGHTTEDIEDITGNADTPIPITFRAWDDMGISRFYYCLINESETEGTDLIRPVNPTRYGEYTYRFNILKSEGNYKYKIIAFDTSNQRTDSNIFNVTVEPPINNPSGSPTPPDVSDSDYIILYDKNTTDFTNNGIGILNNDVIDCIVENEENGIYELTLQYLTTGKYVDELLDTENIIKCKTDISNNEAQLFRIYDTEYIMEENIIIVKANHISYDLKDTFVESVNLVDVTCKQATQTLISRSVGNNKFVVDSDVETIANFKHERVSVLEAVMGIENSIFDVYGKAKLVINRNNFNYSINKQVDNDKGIIIAYSKNLLGFRRNINTNDIITGIYPYAYARTGACIKLKERVLYSENASEYATYKIKAVDFTSDTINDEESLREACKNYFDNGCNLPKISYDVDFIMLYSNNYSLKNQFRSLEEVVLGDIVTIQDSKIGLNVKARVVKTTYNVIKGRYEKIQLGNFKNEYRVAKKNEHSNLKKIVRNIIN